MKVPQSSSWEWMKLLKLRSEPRSFLKFEVVDGSGISYGWIGGIMMEYFTRDMVIGQSMILPITLKPN